MTQLDDFLPYLLRRISTRIDEAISCDLAKIGLNQERWRVLSVLDEIGPQTLTTLSDHVSVNMSTLSRLVDRMISEGFVTRVRSGKGRAVRIAATDLGLMKLAEMREVRDALDKVTGQAIPLQEMQRLKSDLRRLYEVFDQFAALNMAKYVADSGKKPITMTRKNPEC